MRKWLAVVAQHPGRPPGGGAVRGGGEGGEGQAGQREWRAQSCVCPASSGSAQGEAGRGQAPYQPLPPQLAQWAGRDQRPGDPDSAPGASTAWQGALGKPLSSSAYFLSLKRGAVFPSVLLGSDGRRAWQRGRPWGPGAAAPRSRQPCPSTRAPGSSGTHSLVPKLQEVWARQREAKARTAVAGCLSPASLCPGDHSHPQT